MTKTIQLCSISTIHQDWIPYASGCLISYCKSIPEINEKFQFLEPIYKTGKYDFGGVDILGLTCYVWNQSYNDNLAKKYKKINPNGKVIYGGPQIPEDIILKKEFDNKRYWLDKSFIGLGEIAFSEWLLDSPPSGKVLHKLPTPYTDGIFDNIFNNNGTFKVSFESNRGCPYRCAFCDWGGQAKSKLTIFDQNDVFKTIDKIYQYSNIKELEILDANFGILEQDIDIINHMIKCQEKYNNHIKISYSGLAKNGSKHLPVIMSKVFESFPIDQRNLKVSFQTHTPSVLKTIQRSNIDNKKWQKYINTKMHEALSKGNTFTLSAVAFISVYREGFETVLFYKALFLYAGKSTGGIVPGFFAGCVVLAGVFYLVNYLGLRIPIKWFFGFTSVLLYYMAFTFMGKGIHELQMGEQFPLTAAEFLPSISWLGMYPTWETFIGQAVLFLLFIFALVYTFVPGLGGKQSK